MAPDDISPLFKRFAPVKIVTLLALLLASLLSIAAFAQTTDKDWQAKAVQKYPDLGVQGSDFNQRFVAEYNKRRQTTPSFFTNPQWPLLLADELAAPLTTPPAKLTTPASAPPLEPVASVSRSSWLASTWKALPSATKLSFFVAGSTLALAFYFLVFGRFLKWLRWRRICADSDAYLTLLKSSVGLPVVPSTALLQYNERAYYCAPSSLYETRAVRHHESGFASIRVAPGLWIGGSQGRSVSTQEWTKIDSGTLIITNERVIFDGSHELRTIPVKRIVSVDTLRDSVELAVESRQKNMVFEAANPLILASIVRLSSQGYDDLPPGPDTSGRASSNGTTGAPPPRNDSPPPKPKNSRPNPAPEPPPVEPDDVIHARTLGLGGKFDFATVKKHYRDRIQEYHPDRVAALGPKLRELAEAESKKINAAYDYFARKLKADRKS
jgi:hypothetical protein